MKENKSHTCNADILRKMPFGNESADLINNILSDLMKLALSSKDNGDMRLLRNNIKDLCNAFQLFSKYRDIRKVALFGSSRTGPYDPAYKLAEDFAQRIVNKGFLVITGAGGGIMEAGNKGATAANSFGVNIRLPFEQDANKFISEDRLVSFKYFFSRKLVFQKESDATVILPGGFGTVDEMMEILTLVQTGKSRPRPVILLQPEGDDYWTEFNVFIDKMMAHGYISDEDLQLYTITGDAEEAARQISDFYKIYHSLAYVENETVLRFNAPIADGVIEKINKDFRDIIKEGDIEPTEPLPKELERHNHANLYRLKFRFNRSSFGRLIEMIHFINSEVEILRIKRPQKLEDKGKSAI